MGRRSELSVAERRKAVLVLLRREEATSWLGRRYGVSEQTLYRWRDEFLAGGEAALAGSSGKNSDPRKRRIEELERALVPSGQASVRDRIRRYAQSTSGC